MARQKTWFQIQMGQLGLTSEYIAKTLGISRPTLYKIGAMPHRLTVAQLNTLRTLGFAVPGDTSAAPVPNVMPIPCPTCDGTGWLFKPVKMEGFKLQAKEEVNE